MAWSCQSALLPPVRLRTTPATVFSIYMELPPEVEAELDYTGPPALSGGPNRTDVLYRECSLPLEGHFPLLTEKLLLEAELPEEIKLHFSRLLQAELSRLREAGSLGNVVVVSESLVETIRKKVESGEFVWPMEISLPRALDQELVIR